MTIEQKFNNLREYTSLNNIIHYVVSYSFRLQKKERALRDGNVVLYDLSRVEGFGSISIYDDSFIIDMSIVNKYDNLIREILCAYCEVKYKEILDTICEKGFIINDMITLDEFTEYVITKFK